MKKLAICSVLFSAAAFAQTADLAFFRTVMLPSNEVPAVNANVSGVADIIAHVVRDSTGQITSGTVQFLVRANFAADNTAVGLHIHSGAAGVAGPVVIGTALSAGNPQPIKAGGDVVALPVQVTGEGAALTALRGLFADPQQFYVNIHTTDFPGGIMRGQLRQAIGTMNMGLMTSENEVPATGVAATGTAIVVAIATLNAQGGLETGEAYLQTTYKIADGGTFTGFHIHPGAAGINGPVVINSGLPTGIAVETAGGNLGPYYVEINPTNATQVATFTNIFVNPGANYINAHTTLHGGGAMRAQLRQTEQLIYNVTMDSANEPGTITAKETAPVQIALRVIRNEDGTIAAGFVFFDINYRFAGPTNVTMLHIHDGPAGVNAPVSIPIIPAVDPGFTTTTGFGNYFGQTWPIINLAVLEDIIKNPENHYVNIHTSTDPGGAARGQLGPRVNTPAQIDAVIAGNNDKAATTIAPGGLISIYGSRLVKSTSDLSGWAGRTIPSALNGTSVTIGGKTAALLYVSPGQIVAQVPVDVAAGAQAVVVNNGVSPSPAFSTTVAAVAPVIFFSPVAAVVKNSDFSVVSTSNPAKAGDVLVIYMTGLGQTTPAISTGGIVTGLPSTSTVTVKIGDRDAAVAYSIASPGYAGLYQVAITVPTGVTGNSDLVVSQGTTKSNTVKVQIQ